MTNTLLSIIVYFYNSLPAQDSLIDPDVEFPDVHLHIDCIQFVVTTGHTKLYIPDQLLLSEADFMKQQQNKEQVIAKEIDLSALDLNEQQKMLDQYKVKQSISQGEDTTIYIVASVCSFIIITIF